MTGRRVVVLDTCVLFRLDNVRRLDFLGHLVDFDFVFPGEVWSEVKDRGQQRRVLQAVRQRWVRRLQLDLGKEQELLGQALQAGLDLGEAACLALARSRGFVLATDDKAALKAGEAALGSHRLMSTPGLVVHAIRTGIVDVRTADGFIGTWREHKFRVSFRSFQDVS